MLAAGIKFIVYSAFKKDNNEGTAKQLKIGDEKIPILVYDHEKNYKGLIITFTGFSVRGYKDERMVVVSRAFQKLGYKVITPQIAEIDQLLISNASVTRIQAIIEHISKDKTLNPLGYKPAVFAPSYTGGMCALAISQLDANAVSSLCLLGSYCSIEKSIEFLLSNDNSIDDYGMHILMKNFLKYALPSNPKLEEMIQAAIEDNGFKRPIPALPRITSQANSETVALYKRIKNDMPFRKEIIQTALKNIPDASAWLHSLDAAQHVENIACPVVIIHGKNDQVIPCSESISLSEIIKRKNKQVYLEISKLLDHGDIQYNISIVKEAIGMVKAMNKFLEPMKDHTWKQA